MNPTDTAASQAAAHDELLLRAVEAVNRGELSQAHDLAEQVLASDVDNLDAGALRATESQPAGEVRRLTVMFCDLVGSTSLSGRLDPELYRGVLNRYRKLAASIAVERHGGFISGFQGDGMLVLFGYPMVRGNDTERGVMAALEIASEVKALSDQIAPTIGEELAVRAALHRGLLYIDPEQHDVYGFAANVAARLQGLAEPGEVVVSEEVRQLVADRFEMKPGEPQMVRGVDRPLQPFTVLGRLSTKPLSAIRTPLVGRSAELERLREMWRSTADSDAPKVAGATIVGDPGIGKSRLAEYIADDVRIEGGSVVMLSGSPDHQDVGFHPVRRLIETRCRIGLGSPASVQLSRMETDVAALGLEPDDTVPLLAPILGLDPETGYTVAESEGRKLTEEIAKAAADYVLACLGHGPALVLVEDHHAFDDATNDLIDRVLRSGRPRTFLLATSRTAPVSQTQEIGIGPIPRDACLALIDALAPSDARVARDRHALIERSDGVPLFLEELVRGSAFNPVDARRPSQSTESTVPDVLYEPLMARLYVSPATVSVASVAATIGRDVDLDLLAQSVELPADEVQDALENLIDGRILERVAGNPKTVHFRHELVRDVAFDLISPSRRRAVHARVADALMQSVEQDEHGDWTTIASHFERADRPSDAANAWREAAEDARRRGLVAEARARLGAALAQVALLPPGAQRHEREVELRLQRGFLAASADGMSSHDATIDFKRCLELTLEIPHAPNLVSTLIALWGYYTSRGDLARAREASIIVESVVSEEWGAFRRPQNIAGFGMLDWLEGDFVTSERRLQEGIELLYSSDTFDEKAVAAWYMPMHPTVAMHVYMAVARFMAGDTVGADEQGQRALDLSADLPFPQRPWSAAYSRWFLSWMYMERGEYDRSSAVIAEAMAIGEQHGYDVWTLVAMTQRAATAVARSADSAAGASVAPSQAVLGSLVSAWQEVDLRLCLPIHVTMLGRLAAKGGDAKEALARYDESLALARETGMHFYDAETLRCRAHVADLSDEVVHGLSDALEVARRQGARPFELRIALDLYDIRGEAAVDELRAAVDGFRADASYAELDHARARLAQAGR